MKNEPWRIVVAIISIILIIGMWIKNRISIDMSLPLLLTTLTVSLTKVLVFAGFILLVKYIISRIRK